MMMIATSGPMVKVTGRRMAMVATGPRPGSTPINVRSIHP